MRTPIVWFGGKGNMTAKLLPLLPAHKRYCEPFGGGASLLFAKAPAELEVYNDIDEGLVGFFCVLADPSSFGRFYRRVSLLPYSRALYNDYRRTWAAQKHPVERAVRWFVVNRQSFAGRFGSSWGSVVTASSRTMTERTSAWLSAIERLPAAHARLQRVQIECADWRTILDRYDTSETLFYCDPPYAHASRSSTRYAHEMSDADHADLVARLLALQGMAVVSSYASPIYSPLAKAGWRRIAYKTVCFAAGRTRATGLKGKGSVLRHQKRLEIVWINR